MLQNTAILAEYLPIAIFFGIATLVSVIVMVLPKILAKETPQKETTPFHPRSAYAVSKVTGYHLVKNYREAYNLHACNGILFNHESPRRGFEFVTRKISYGVARIKKGLQKKIKLEQLRRETY